MIYTCGVDPGDTSGVCLLSTENKKTSVEEVYETKDVFSEQFKNTLKKADFIVVENFFVRPKKAKQGAFDWNPMNTIKIIGQIEALAHGLGKKVILQQPAQKVVGYGLAGMKYVPGKKNMHQYDAVAHAMFYLVKNNLSLLGVQT